MTLIIPEILVQAKEETADHCSQIQGFLYCKKGAEKAGQHVLRDCTKPHGDQVLWSKFAEAYRYEETHREMELETEIAKSRIIAAQYDRIVRELQPGDELATGPHRKFPCPCGGEYGIVVDSRPNFDGTIRRRRKCSSCGKRTSTAEFAIEDIWPSDG